MISGQKRPKETRIGARMVRKTISQLGIEAAIELERIGYAPVSVRHYLEIFNGLARYAAERGISLWSEEIVYDFIRDRRGWDRAGGGSPSQHVKAVIRGCLMLGFFESTGAIPGKACAPCRKVPPAMRGYLETMVSDDISRGISEATMRGRHSDVTDFLLFLDREGIPFPDGVDADAIEGFTELKHREAPGAIPRVLSSVRCFLRCMYAYGLMGSDLSPLVPKASRYPRKPVSKIWTSEEVSALVDSIPRHDSAGKRDFAIVSLLVAFGMRDGDVRRLRMTDIDWDASVIRLVQHKNGVSNTLPMTDAVGWALADWLANGRPKQASCPEVFTRLTAPYGPLSDVSSIFDRRAANAGISKVRGVKSGPHSLRHSVASAMLRDGAQVPVIASVLGDGMETATKVYIHADIDGLRRCALGGEE